MDIKIKLFVLSAITLVIMLSGNSALAVAKFSDCPTTYGTLVCGDGEYYCGGCKSGITYLQITNADLNCTSCNWSCTIAGQVLCNGACQAPDISQNCSSLYHRQTDACAGNCLACETGYTGAASGTTVCTKIPDPYIFASPLTPQSAYINITGSSTVGKLIVSDKAMIDGGMAMFGSYWNGTAMTTPINLIEGQNLFYGQINNNSTGGNFLLLEKGDGNAASSMLSVSKDGGLFASDYVSSTQFCLQGICKTGWDQISGVGYWNLNGNNLFASSTNYNVGIGTTTPNSKFEVFDGVNNPNSVARIRVTDTSQNPEIQLQYGSSANNHWGIYNRTDGLGGYDNSLNIWGGGNDRLTILQNGFVGIGTTTPAANLHIAMEASYRSSLKIEGGESVIIMKDVDANLDQKVKGIMVANGNMSFFRQTDAETTRYDQLILLNNGFVGIGTTTPAANLVVNGWTDITTGLSIKTDNLWVEKGDIIIQGSNKGLVADVVTSTKLCLGGVCKNAWPSDNVYVGVTSINGGINGNLGGYTGANGICFGAYPGSHLCTVEEMLYSINSGTVISFTGWAWISNGAYTGVGSANADCKGWTAAISDYYATIWDGSAGYAKQTVCTVSNKLACCK